MAQINPLAAQNEGDVRTRGILRGAATADTGVGAVSDIAFSPDGKKIYIVAPTRNGEDTMFRVGTIGSKDRVGRRLHHLRPEDGRADDRGRPDQGLRHRAEARRGQEAPGRRRLPDRPETFAAGTQPVRVGDAFNAVGHFRLAPNGEAWATEAPAGQAPTSTTPSAGLRTSPAGRRRPRRSSRSRASRPGRHRRVPERGRRARRHGLRRGRDQQRHEVPARVPRHDRDCADPARADGTPARGVPADEALLVTSEDGFACASST